MQRIFSKAFWQIILPFIMAFMMAVAETMAAEGRLRGGIVRASVSIYGAAAIFCYFLSVSLRNTVRWSKEAEGYETDLKKAEQERRRKEAWRKQMNS